MVQSEQAQVFRAETGRRFFTLRAACNAEARERMRQRYPCECESETGFVCARHGDTGDIQATTERLAVRLARQYRLRMERPSRAEKNRKANR